MTTTVNPAEYNSPIKPTWCPGCGNFSIINAIRQALVEQNLSPTDVLLVFDIGCNGNMADKINVYGYKGLHGRSIPVAAGAKIANKKLKVLAIGGDGGTFDEGIHHFIHGIRNNYDITFLMHNNCNFGLTTGQETPMTPKGQPMPISPWGTVGERLNPVQLALTSGATFVANGWTGNIKQMKELIIAGMQHNGFSFVNIYQDCPTYNKFEDLDWLRAHVEDISVQQGYDVTNKLEAFKACDYSNDKRPVGIVYKDPNSASFMDRLGYRSSYTTELIEEVSVRDINDFIAEFV